MVDFRINWTSAKVRLGNRIISVNLRKKLQDFLLLEGFPTPIYALFASNRGWKPLQQEEKDVKLTLMVRFLNRIYRGGESVQFFHTSP